MDTVANFDRLSTDLQEYLIDTLAIVPVEKHEKFATHIIIRWGENRTEETRRNTPIDSLLAQLNA